MKYDELGNYEEKDSLELDRLLNELTLELEEDYKKFETTKDSNEKLDAHNDIKFEKEQIMRIKSILKAREDDEIDELGMRR